MITENMRKNYTTQIGNEEITTVDLTEETRVKFYEKMKEEYLLAKETRDVEKIKKAEWRMVKAHESWVFWHFAPQ